MEYVISDMRGVIKTHYLRDISLVDEAREKIANESRKR